MKKISFLVLLGLCLISCFSALAEVNDVHDPRTRIWVKVDLDWGKKKPISLEKAKVNFTKCFDAKCGRSEPIGKSKHYNLAELVSQRHVEYGKMSGVIVADLAICVFGSYGAATYAIGAGLGEGAGIVLGVYGAPVGIVTGAASVIKYINPIHYYDQADAINSEVILDKDVQVTSIEDYIDALESVLENIDP